MKALDILWLLLLIWGAYSGFKRGFVLEACSLGAFLIATISIVKVVELCTQLLHKWDIKPGRSAHYIIFVLAFLVIVLIIILIGRLFKHLVHMTFLSGVDKLMGIMLGAFKWLVFIEIFLWIANFFQFHIPHSYLADTYFLPLAQSFVPRFLAWLSTYFPYLQDWLLVPVQNHTVVVNT